VARAMPLFFDMIRNISSVLLVVTLLGLSACGKNSVMCRMRQNDAKVDLSTLNDAEAKYRETHGHFASAAQLAFTAPNPEYYDVTVVSSSPDTYQAKAIGKRKLAGDVWTVNQLGHPVSESSACR
jgi:hypothetical protein